VKSRDHFLIGDAITTLDASEEFFGLSRKRFLEIFNCHSFSQALVTVLHAGARFEATPC
jgi:hypothetical protein